MTEAYERLFTQLAANGIVTSFAYGPCAGRGIQWSVHCMKGTEEFTLPFLCRDIEHGIVIALAECAKLGWFQPDDGLEEFMFQHGLGPKDMERDL